MPDALSTLLAALHADPSDATAWLALADALEEDGQPRRAELVRLSRSLDGVKRDKGRKQRERRLRDLLAGGVEPCVPLVTNSIGMRLALIPAGAFLMGSPARERNHVSDEGPRHEVRISRPFYFGIFTVTQAEYRAVTGENPSYFGRGAKRRRLDVDRLPVERVDWPDCVAFCQSLSEQPEEKAMGRAYRLPTEAEWEYACRAGTTTATHFGDDLSSTQANFDGNHPYANGEKGGYLKYPTVVGSYRPNAFGLYDVHGNVWEWCHDWYGQAEYQQGPRIDPRGPATGSHHLLRGGSWKNYGYYLRSSHRGWSTADERIGFRVAMDWHGSPSEQS
jgi:formylglycine-generating enzyme